MEPVVASLAINCIIAFLAEYAVIALAAKGFVVTCSEVDCIAPTIAFDPIRRIAAVDIVGTGTAMNSIFSLPAVDAVSAASAKEFVLAC